MSKASMSDRQILERFSQVVAESLRIERELVTEDAYLDDLGAESLDLAEITMETEEKFDILIPQRNILQTATEVFGEGVLIKEGRLTEEGKRFFCRRMPEHQRSLEELTEADLNRLFLRVGTWVGMIKGLMEHTPRTCPQCDAPFGKAVAGRLKCPSCSSECDIPSGDDLNREWVQRYYDQEHAPSQGHVPAPSAPAL